MKKNGSLLFIVFLLVIVAIYATTKSTQKHDEWHNYDGSEIICRVVGCGKRPLYSDWDNRFCAEHIDRSKNRSNEYNPSIAHKKINTERALTKEEADALRGTGYHGCRPYSSAENTELAAAMNKCINCGMHSKNGRNSLCYECQYNKDYGFD